MMIFALLLFHTATAVLKLQSGTELQRLYEEERKANPPQNPMRVGVFTLLINGTEWQPKTPVDPHAIPFKKCFDTRVNKTDPFRLCEMGPLYNNEEKKMVRVEELLGFYCSYKRCPGHLPLNVMISGWNEDVMKKLRGNPDLILHDVSEHETLMKDIFNGVYSKETYDGNKERYCKMLKTQQPPLLFDERTFVDTYCETARMPITQNRWDGWATYFKFLMWNRTDYDMILYGDADCCISKCHDVAKLLSDHPGPFWATRLRRGSPGLTAGLFAMTPSKVVFDALIRTAKEGYYLPMANGDQDILESIFGLRRQGKWLLTGLEHGSGTPCWQKFWDKDNRQCKVVKD